MKFQRQVKKVKSLIRGYDAVDLLDALYNYMNAQVKDDAERLRRHPWLIMLIIKWNLLENRVHPEFSKVLTNTDFMRILNTTYDLNKLVRMPGDGRHHRNFMRNLAFQQFVYQKSLSSTTVASNHLLFSNLPENHRLKVKFEEVTGLDMKSFNQCCLVIYAAFSKSKSVTLNDFKIISGKVGERNIEKALNLLSVDLRCVKGLIKDNNRSNGTYSEWYEQSLFLKFPLVKYDDKYTCLNIYILLRCIEGYIYDLLKSNDSQWFMDNFGKVFENYLNKGLVFSGCKYVEESVIKKGLPKGVNVIDFIINENGCNIFMDAKAVELPYLGKVSDDPKVILGKVKTSAIKAIKQANVLNNYIYGNSLKSVGFEKINYLLVVTYKELYLGNGVTFYDSIAKEAIDDIVKGLEPAAIIPLENIYFITLEEFDLLCSAINHSCITFQDILQRAKENDSKPQTMKFDFMQHLNSLNVELLRPDYLDNSIKELTDLLPH